MTPKTLGELATLLGGEVVGEEQYEIAGVAALSEAGPRDLSFLADPKYETQARSSKAGAILVREPLAGSEQNLLIVRDPHMALAVLLPHFFDTTGGRDTGVHADASVDAAAVVHETVTVGALAVISAGAAIGARTIIGAGVIIERNAVIGADCCLHSNVVIREGCVLGDRVVAQAGAVVGSDGFGFAVDKDGYHKIPQVGIVRVEDNVEIGANATIDRGSIGETRIGRGVKLDNQVHLGHNSCLGDHSALAAQVGVSGSVDIGRWVRLGGQVGVAGHLSIGDGCVIAGQGGVIGNVPAGAIYAGFPARPHKDWVRGQAEVRRMAGLRTRVRALETLIAELRSEIRSEPERPR